MWRLNVTVVRTYALGRQPLSGCSILVGVVHHAEEQAVLFTLNFGQAKTVCALLSSAPLE